MIETDYIEGVLKTPISVIETQTGKVLHGMKSKDVGFVGFGEAYFSSIRQGVINGWKKHEKMTVNFMVPVGEIKFVIFDDREGSPTFNSFYELSISLSNYFRLSIPPRVWFAFEGKGRYENVLLNIANIHHDPSEVRVKPLHEIKYNW